MGRHDCCLLAPSLWRIIFRCEQQTCSKRTWKNVVVSDPLDRLIERRVPEGNSFWLLISIGFPSLLDVRPYFFHPSKVLQKASAWSSLTEPPRRASVPTLDTRYRGKWDLTRTLVRGLERIRHSALLVRIGSGRLRRVLRLCISLCGVSFSWPFQGWWKSATSQSSLELEREEGGRVF